MAEKDRIETKQSLVTSLRSWRDYYAGILFLWQTRDRYELIGGGVARRLETFIHTYPCFYLILIKTPINKRWKLSYFANEAIIRKRHEVIYSLSVKVNFLSPVEVIHKRQSSKFEIVAKLKLVVCSKSGPFFNLNMVLHKFFIYFFLVNVIKSVCSVNLLILRSPCKMEIMTSTNDLQVSLSENC